MSKESTPQVDIREQFVSDVRQIIQLAQQIEPEYGSGFGIRPLELARQFYREYPITNTLRSQLN